MSALKNEMSDLDLISYAEIHCETPRALFSPEHANRLITLAGNPPGYPTATGWVTGHEDMAELCRLARARMEFTPTIEPRESQPSVAAIGSNARSTCAEREEDLSRPIAYMTSDHRMLIFADKLHSLPSYSGTAGLIPLVRESGTRLQALERDVIAEAATTLAGTGHVDLAQKLQNILSETGSERQRLAGMVTHLRALGGTRAQERDD